MASQSEPTLYWLDAHWSGGDTAGEENECPVLDEISAIGGLGREAFNVILIDDARLFLSPPPAPHRAAQWPDIWQVLSALKCHHGGHIVIHDDVIFSLPIEIKDWAVRYFQAAVSRDGDDPD